MANRRMFSKRITNSARFLKMGAGAQALYFHLCMNADDDGAVEAFMVKRSIGANEDDLQNLIGRGFIRVIDQENEIVVINDWLEHNQLRADRITPSIYRNLIERTAPDVKLIEPKQRADRQKKPGPIDVSAGQNGNGTDMGPHWDGNGTSQGQPKDGNGTVMGPLRLGEVSIGKDSLGKDSEGKEREEKTNGAKAPSRPRFMRPTIQEIQQYCSDKGYKHVDAEYFWNYYENINWHVGKNKMKSWKLAVANWEKRQAEFERSKARPSHIPQSKQEIVTRTPEEAAAQPEWGAGIFDTLY